MKTFRELINLVESAQTPVQQYKIYFVIPEHDDYDDRHEPTETTIVTASSANEAGKKFRAEVPEAYIEQIVPLNYNKGVAEAQKTDNRPASQFDREIVKAQPDGSCELKCGHKTSANLSKNPIGKKIFCGRCYELRNKEQGVAEAIGQKDLISRLQKDLPRIDDPKNKDAEPVKWTGPKKGDYGYTGYQGHGMPTDRAERARIRADKKKGVAEDSEAHRLGSQAAARGRPYSTNPYPAGSKNHLEWSQAHNSIRARRAQEVDEQATPEAVAKINSLFSK